VLVLAEGQVLVLAEGQVLVLGPRKRRGLELKADEPNLDLPPAATSSRSTDQEVPLEIDQGWSVDRSHPVNLPIQEGSPAIFWQCSPGVRGKKPEGFHPSESLCPG
jgi:virulence-associated protein VagC